MWVAVLEDDPLVARVTARDIERRHGATVATARNLHEFRGLLAQASEPPAVALLDLDLGAYAGGDGVDALSELRARGWTTTTVAFFTATPVAILDARLQRRGLASEVSTVFEKPVEVGRIAAWLNGKDSGA